MASQENLEQPTTPSEILHRMLHGLSVLEIVDRVLSDDDGDIYHDLYWDNLESVYLAIAKFHGFSDHSLEVNTILSIKPTLSRGRLLALDLVFQGAESRYSKANEHQKYLDLESIIFDDILNLTTLLQKKREAHVSGMTLARLIPLTNKVVAMQSNYNTYVESKHGACLEDEYSMYYEELVKRHSAAIARMYYEEIVKRHYGAIADMEYQSIYDNFLSEGLVWFAVSLEDAQDDNTELEDFDA